MKSFLKLFGQPSLVVLGFMLAYVLVHAELGLSVKKNHIEISQNAEKNEMEYQNSAIPYKQKEANTPTTVAEESPTKNTLLPLETASQEKEAKQEIKQEIKQEQAIQSTQNNALSIQSDQKTPAIGKKPLEYKVIVSGVNVRSFPSIKGKIIGLLLKNTSVKILEIQKDWAEIEFTKETKGYVFLKYLKKVE
ncbi:SH3 domain-containing protein [Helicobacter acinonychis]|uniref:SH3 domain-containing protein n=1 Tax=Helicobacter acinonychis TaxID=212 RepID=UPI000CF1404B|nr:SH3 domain-containing protein [Helicobacter acinonychis]